MCVFVVALSSRALVDKWPNGIDFNFENAALHFSLYNIVGTPGGWGGGGEVGGKSCCARGSILLRTTSTSWGEFTVPTGKHACTTTQTYAHTHTEDILHMS